MSTFDLKKGYNLFIGTEPEQNITEISSPELIKINPFDFKYIKPKSLVKVGDKVLVGTPILMDKNNPDFKYTSPCSGSIDEIDYGERRKLNSINIKNDHQYEQLEQTILKQNEHKTVKSMDVDILKNIILESGLWCTIRRRPFSTIPSIDKPPKSIFVSFTPTYPLAGDQSFILNHDSNGFFQGLDILSRLTDGFVHLCMGRGQKIPHLDSLKKVKVHYFSGPHPSGNIGVQIHHIDPISNRNDYVWYIHPQDICSLGKLFQTNLINSSKVITIGGTGCTSPQYVKIKRGTPVNHILKELNLDIDDRSCFISGDVLSGKKITTEHSVGFYDECITILKEEKTREFLGWLSFGFNKFTITNSYLSRFNVNRPSHKGTMKNGSERPIVPIGLWEKMLPMDILPTFLIKSILAEDIEDMERLGIYETAGEDFALCSFICQSKVEVSQIIENGLKLVHDDG